MDGMTKGCHELNSNYMTKNRRKKTNSKCSRIKLHVSGHETTYAYKAHKYG